MISRPTPAKIDPLDAIQEFADRGGRITLFRNHVGAYTARLHSGTVLNHHQSPRREVQIDGKSLRHALQRLADKLTREDFFA